MQQIGVLDDVWFEERTDLCCDSFESTFKVAQKLPQRFCFGLLYAFKRLFHELFL